LLKNSSLSGFAGHDSLVSLICGDLVMMGHQEVSAQLFYDFQIEDHVPAIEFLLLLVKLAKL